MNKYRTHNCGELNKAHIGQDVKLSGWVHRRRDHGGLAFIDLRDHFGLTQCVINENEELTHKIAHLHYESVITITGTVVAREEGACNSNMSIGDIEVNIKTFSYQI